MGKNGASNLDGRIPGTRLANWLIRRFCAAWIDFLIFTGILCAWAFSPDKPQAFSLWSDRLEYIGGLFLIFVYFAPELLWRRTLGMRLTGLVLVTPPVKSQWGLVLMRKGVNFLESTVLWPAYIWSTALTRDCVSLSDFVSGCRITRGDVARREASALSKSMPFKMRLCVATVFTLVPLVVVCVAGLTVVARYHLFADLSRLTAPWNKPIPAEGIKEDLDFAFATIARVHPNMYAYITERDFAEVRWAVYHKANRAMTPLDLYRILAPAVASLESSHSGLAGPPGWEEYWRSGGKFYPIEIGCHHGAPILTQYYGPWHPLVGSRITAINGEPAERVLSQLSRYWPSEDRVGDWAELTNNGDWLAQALWLEYDTSPLSLEMTDLNGGFVKVTVDPVTSEERKAIVARMKPKGWRRPIAVRETFQAGGDSGSGFGGRFGYGYSEEGRTAYLRIETFSYRRLLTFREFVAKAFEDMNRRDASALIIDLRGNPGGCAAGGHLLFRYLTDKRIVLQEGDPKYWRLCGRLLAPKAVHFSGRIFVLIGPHTASCAALFAAAAKYYRIATLLGEETGDTKAGYGETVFSRLPNSGLVLGVASDHTVAIGAEPRDTSALAPDYNVEQTPEDTAKSVDTVLEFALRLAKHAP